MNLKFLPLVYVFMFIPILSGIAQQQNDKHLILSYDFKNSVKDGKILDSSPNGISGTIKGEGASIENGELYLSGGNTESNAPYVEIPSSVFQKNDTLSISVWLKNETGSGNYAAMFIGTKESLPQSYWLLNPANGSGRLKSVITNAVSDGSPWNTEYGFSPSNNAQGVPGPISSKEWNLYTTILTPSSIISYYNDAKIGEVAISRRIADFGNDIVAYIGRSSYNDPFYKGRVKRLRIYNSVLSDNQVKNEYYSVLGSKATLEVLEKDKALLNIGELKVINDIFLPSVGKNGSNISWESSNSSCLNNSGIIKRKNKKDQKAVLTATLALAGEKVTKSFDITILANTLSNNLAYYTKQLDIAIDVATNDIILPTRIGDNYSISWESNNKAVIDNHGQVFRPEIGNGNQQVTLTATISAKGKSLTKEFNVTVLEENYGFIASYILKGGQSDNDKQRAGSYFAAHSHDGKEYTSLNNEKALIYPLVGSKKMRFPTIFRKPDGSFGLIASDNNTNGFMVYDSKDLVEYTNERYLKLNTQEGVEFFTCKYDNAKKTYAIQWKGQNGKYFESLTANLKTIDTTSEIASFSISNEVERIPTGAKDFSSIGLTKNEYEKILLAYGKIHNTGIEKIADVKVKVGTTVNLPETITAKYSDGSSKKLAIKWNQDELSNIDINKPGTYSINGTVQQPKYTSPLIAQRADPWIFKGDDGYYYFTASYPMVGHNDPEGYDRVILRRAKTIEGLATAKEITIWDEANTDSSFRYIWAPEIHQINGNWYVFFTTSVSNRSPWSIRPRIIACNKGEKDPFNPECWEKEGHLMEASNGDEISFTNFSLDMTHFESNGVHYVAWAQSLGHSSILIASVDANKPWKTTSKFTIVTRPEYAWEWEDVWVNEGPAVIKNNGKIFLAFSASAVNHTYCVGMLSAEEGTDLLDVNSWKKSRYPLLSTEDLPKEQNGPGHNSFTIDEYGNPMIIYHARNPKETIDGGLYDPGRHAFAKSVNFSHNGTPILNITREQELDPKFKEVQVKVIVE